MQHEMTLPEGQRRDPKPSSLPRESRKQEHEGRKACHAPCRFEAQPLKADLSGLLELRAARLRSPATEEEGEDDD